jgi:hypothetical protein
MLGTERKQEEGNKKKRKDIPVRLCVLIEKRKKEIVKERCCS